MSYDLKSYIDQPCELKRESLTTRLERREKQLQEQLEEVSNALRALRKNPELQDLLDVVSKVA